MVRNLPLFFINRATPSLTKEDRFVVTSSYHLTLYLYLYSVRNMSIYLRLTPATKDVLYQLYCTTEDVWGLQLSRRAERPTGTVYPLLERLEREGFVQSHWDDDSIRSGPRRRLYILTPAGRIWVQQKLKLGSEAAKQQYSKGVDYDTPKAARQNQSHPGTSNQTCPV